MDDRTLLNIELSCRLPYGLIIREASYEYDMISNKEKEVYYEIDLTYSNIYEYVEYDVPIKLYLRPMSSMTKKEKERYALLKGTIEGFDYLNSIHIDYRGLISKDLAIEAPEGMYNNNQ